MKKLLSPTTSIKIRIKLLKLRYRLSPLEVRIRRVAFKRWSASTLGAIMTIVVAFSVFSSGTQVANAQTLSLSSQDLSAGTSSFSAVNRTSTSLSLQNSVVGQWNGSNGLQLPPTLSYGTTNLAYGPNDTMYYLAELNSSCMFEKYDVERQIWIDLNAPPIGCGTGNILIYDQVSSMYYLPGNSSQRMFRYDIPTDTWSEQPPLPTNVGDVSSGIYAANGSNHYLFVFRGLSSPSFWRYDLTAQTWSNQVPFPTASNVNNGIEITWDGANTIYALSNDVGEFKKYDIPSNTWTTLGTVSNSCQRSGLQYANGKVYEVRLYWCDAEATMKVYTVATSTWADTTPPASQANVYDFVPPITYDGSRYFYTLFQSDTHPLLYRYDTVGATWTNSSLMTPSTDNTQYHYKLIPDNNGNAYYFGSTYSGATDRAYKYNLNTKTATRVGAQINTLGGASGVANGGYLYLMPYVGSTNFVRYDTTANTFTSLTDLPFASGNGTDIVDGGDGNLYVLFGGGRTNFYRYNIAANTWASLTTMPQGPSQGDGITRIGTKMYVLVGNQSGYLMQYDMSLNSWSYINNMPEGSIDWGGWLTSDTSRYLYVGMSSRTDVTAKKVYRYDTTSATWQRIADLPASTLPWASGFYDTSSSKLYVAQGQDSPYVWDWSPGTNSFVTSGSWYSKTYDFKQVQTWTSLTANISGSGTTTIYTRTSPNGKIWTNWSATSGTAITSPVNRYMQMKVSLSSDGTVTPTISNLAVNYTQETSPPALPAQLNAYDSKGGTQLVSGQTYESEHPYFSWAASSDGANGSGVAGYYVYYGTDSNGDPTTDGSFQTTTDYTVTAPMTAGDIYYLRIAVKDNLGNTSSAATFFSYRYFYISPPGSLVETSTPDFTNGINTNIDSSSDSLKLVQQSQGAWTTGPTKMLPDNVTGPASVVVGTNMYVARGTGTSVFWRYNIPAQSWSTLSAVPSVVNTGSSLTWDGGNFLYLIAGGTTTNFYKYNIQNDQWTTMVPLPSSAQAGSAITWLGNNQMAVFFTNVREFYISTRPQTCSHQGRVIPQLFLTRARAFGMTETTRSTPT